MPGTWCPISALRWQMWDATGLTNCIDFASSRSEAAIAFSPPLQRWVSNAVALQPERSEASILTLVVYRSPALEHMGIRLTVEAWAFRPTIKTPQSPASAAAPITCATSDAGVAERRLTLPSKNLEIRAKSLLFVCACTSGSNRFARFRNGCRSYPGFCSPISRPGWPIQAFRQLEWGSSRR
jgi:hypothetical protein